MMKKIKVCDLAKSKKISSKEMIAILTKKGLKNIRAISYVDASILDETPLKKETKPRIKAPATQKVKPVSGKVSHIFSAPSRGSTATAEVLREEKESSPEKLIEERKKKEAELKKKKDAEKAKRLASALRKPKETGKKPSYHAMLVASLALILGLFGVWKIQDLTSRVVTDQKLLAGLETKLAGFETSMQGNSANITMIKEGIVTIKKDVSDLSTKVANADISVLESQLKSEATILRGLSGSLKDPIKTRALNLADNLSTF